jgi:hypothetical protein
MPPISISAKAVSHYVDPSGANWLFRITLDTTALGNGQISYRRSPSQVRATSMGGVYWLPSGWAGLLTESCIRFARLSLHVKHPSLDPPEEKYDPVANLTPVSGRKLHVKSYPSVPSACKKVTICITHS